MAEYARGRRNAADVIVVGGGHNGLVAACYLLQAGRSVLVLEGLDRPGGGSRTEETVPGHRFDLHSVAHNIINMTAIPAELGLAGAGLVYQEMDPFSVAVHADGRRVRFHRSVEATADSIAEIDPAEARAYRDFLRLAEPVVDAVLPAIRGQASAWELPGRARSAARVLRRGPLTAARDLLSPYDTLLPSDLTRGPGCSGRWCSRRGVCRAGGRRDPPVVRAVDERATAQGCAQGDHRRGQVSDVVAVQTGRAHRRRVETEEHRHRDRRGRLDDVDPAQDAAPRSRRAEAGGEQREHAPGARKGIHPDRPETVETGRGRHQRDLDPRARVEGGRRGRAVARGPGRCAASGEERQGDRQHGRSTARSTMATRPVLGRRPPVTDAAGLRTPAGVPTGRLPSRAGVMGRAAPEGPSGRGRGAGPRGRHRRRGMWRRTRTSMRTISSVTSSLEARGLLWTTSSLATRVAK